MTDQELQRWLAAQFPEEICSASDNCPVNWFFWMGGQRDVSDYEWLHIVSLVEARLGRHKEMLYFHQLNKVLRREKATITAFRASWQQRAKALMEVMK